MSVTSRIRRQGGAAVVTIPPALLKLLQADVGSEVELNVKDGALVARPVLRSIPKRYSLRELLKGSEHLADLNASAAWANDGDATGRELA